MYIRTFYNFCCCRCFLFRSRLYTLLPSHTHTHTHCFIALHAHKYFFLSHTHYSCSPPRWLVSVFWVPHSVFFSAFTVNVYFLFFRPFAASFSILGHSMRFLFLWFEVCLCNVYGYCNVFVGACLDNFPKLLLFLLLFLFCPCFIATSVVSICYAMQFTKLRFACASQINKIP